MQYKNFEKLPVWNEGIRLTVRIFSLTKDSSFHNCGDIANQIQRAALSISNNIAEGFERGTTAELLQFLYYAKGSAGEVRSICHVIERIDDFSHLRQQAASLRSLAENISRQLGAWAFSLQESEIKGNRHLTEGSKNNYHQNIKAQAFADQLKKQHNEMLARLKRERSQNQNPEI